MPTIKGTTPLGPLDGDRREDMADVTVKTDNILCASTTCASRHPDVLAHSSSIRLRVQGKPLGYIKSYTFAKDAMDLTSLDSMWGQCQAFDELHAGTKMEKVDNFLANESFSVLAAGRIAAAEVVIYIDRVWLEVKSRGQGLGLRAVRRVIEALRPTSGKAIVMLQAGDLGGGGCNAHEASEKLTAYWGRLGFRPGSESDESWLLLWLEEGRRPVRVALAGRAGYGEILTSNVCHVADLIFILYWSTIEHQTGVLAPARVSGVTTNDAWPLSSVVMDFIALWMRTRWQYSHVHPSCVVRVSLMSLPACRAPHRKISSTVHHRVPTPSSIKDPAFTAT